VSEHEYEVKRPPGAELRLHVVPAKSEPEASTSVPGGPEVGSSVNVGGGGTMKEASPKSPVVPVTVIVYDVATAPTATVKVPDTPPDDDIEHDGLEMMLLGDDVIVQGPASPAAKLEPETRTLVPGRPEVGINAIVGPTVNVAVAESEAGVGGLGVVGGIPMTVTV
jgi:hypothetical protein